MLHSVHWMYGQLGRWLRWSACDVGEPTEGSENELWHRWQKGWRMNRAYPPTFPSLNLHHSSFSKPSATLLTSQLILQPFYCFTYITVYSPTLPLLHLRHSSFSNPSIASPMSQLILQPFFHFSYITWRAAHVILLSLLSLFRFKIQNYQIFV